MTPSRAVSLLAIIATIFTGSLTCAPASADIPTCRGQMRRAVDRDRGGLLPTREAAAARALEVTYELDVRSVVLTRGEGNRAVATKIDGVLLAEPPTVVIEAAERGFVPAEVICLG
jgi:hypothetical protein